MKKLEAYELKLKGKKDSNAITEKSRVKFMKSKGCDVFKLIQDDKISSKS